MKHFQIVCGDCGSEIKQEGVFLKCQNWECKTEVPIDTGMMRDALAMANEEYARQSPEV